MGGVEAVLSARSAISDSSGVMREYLATLPAALLNPGQELSEVGGAGSGRPFQRRGSRHAQRNFARFMRLPEPLVIVIESVRPSSRSAPDPELRTETRTAWSPTSATPGVQV